MDQPILTKKTLLNYLIIKEPGIVQCKVAATVQPNHLINGVEPYYVVYLRVIMERKYKEILKKLEDNPYLDFYEQRHLFLTGIIFENQIKKDYELPSKGETVVATFGFKGPYFKATHIELLPRYALKRIDITEIYPLVKLFKTYFNEKLNHQSEISENGEDTIPEL